VMKMFIDVATKTKTASLSSRNYFLLIVGPVNFYLVLGSSEESHAKVNINQRVSNTMNKLSVRYQQIINNTTWINCFPLGFVTFDRVVAKYAVQPFRTYNPQRVTNRKK
jgi:hypothetical protein